ncbi:plasminogen-like [Pecten maximus]|uniref:plasminogen-like n=1 Tax=Pecten maximus TaxID=6579 RepID=UPI001458FEB1|nr:plasminogen-like [Pecten maximus]
MLRSLISSIYIVLLCSSMKAASETCLMMDQALLKRNSVASGDILWDKDTVSPILCMKECLTLPVCKSVNIYPNLLRCELLLEDSGEASNGVVSSSIGMTIDAVDIPKDYGGDCRDHSCLSYQKCIEKPGSYVCVAYEFCTGSPPPYGANTITIDRTDGLPVATYHCPPGVGYNRGERHSYCDPKTKKWSAPGLTCASGIPNGCGIPPPLPVPHGITRHYEGDLFRAVYTCPSLDDQEPADHCPSTRCIGVEEWTPGANISCSAKDCYTTTEYDGSVTCTKTGRTCQRWDQQTPHAHIFFVDRSDFHNYCRITPDVGMPWCFTTDIFVRWELCPVSKC